MKKNLLFNPYLIHSWFSQIEDLRKEMLSMDFILDRDQIYTEEEVCRMLQVTPRTLRSYRKNNKLHYIRLGGRIYYSKLLLHIDILLESEERYRLGS